MALTNQVIGGAGIAGGVWTIQNTNTATVGRYHDLAFLTEGAGNGAGFTQSRPGCLAGSCDTGTQIPNCFATLPNGGLNISIRRGTAVVERTALSGPYTVQVRASGQVTLGTADATNPRIDRVDLQVFDGAQADNGGVSLTQYVVTQGVAAGTPTVPAAPSNSVSIVQCRLPANTTTITGAMLTDVRRSAALRGGIRPMLPGDLLADVGFGSGDWRDTTTVATVPTVDRWNNATASWVRAIELVPPPSAYGSSSNAITQLSSIAYNAVRDTGSAIAGGTTFVAPASGVVLLTFGMNIRNNGAAVGSVIVAPNVFLGSTIGSGSALVSAADAIGFASTVINGFVPGAKTLRVTGLTPGTTYNAFMSWRMSVASTTADASNPWVSVDPKAA